VLLATYDDAKFIGLSLEDGVVLTPSLRQLISCLLDMPGCTRKRVQGADGTG
jgi:hypothetical protein